MKVIQQDSMTIEAMNRPDLERQLERGIKTLINKARELGDRGILLTRLSPHDYLIELDPTVPFGTTLEHCRWSNRDDN